MSASRFALACVLSRLVLGGAIAGPPAVTPADYDDPLPPKAICRLGSERLWHPGGVTAVAIAPDGSITASVGRDKRLATWSVPTGKLVARIELGQVGTALAWSPDGKTLAVGQEAGKLELRAPDLTTVRATLDAGATVQSLSFVSGALAAATEAGALKLWDAAGKPLPAPAATGARAVAFAASGQSLAWSDATGGVHLAPMGPGPERVLKGHTKPVDALAWTADSKTLASGAQDETIRIWDAAAGTLRATLDWPMNPVAALAWSRDGALLASGSGLRLIRLWKGSEGRNMTTDEADHGRIVALSFGPEIAPGKPGLLVSGCADGTVRYWATDTRKKEVIGLERHRDRIATVAFSADGKLAAIGSPDGATSVWDAATGMRMMKMVTPSMPRNAVNAIAFAPDGSFLTVGQENRDVIAWPLKPDARGKFHGRRELRAHGDEIRALGWTPDSRQLILGTTSGRVRILDPSAESAARAHNPDPRFAPELKRWQAHPGPITALAVSVDGQMVATADATGAIRVWDLPAGTQRLALAGHTGTVRALAFAPGGDIFSCGDDGTVRSWDLVTGQPGRAYPGHTGAVRGVACSTDGQWLATGGADATVRIYKVATGACVQTLTGHTGPVNAVAFSPDGRSVLSGSDDRTGLIWRPFDP